MEDIVRKLTKKKPVLIHQAYSKLMSLMLEKKKNGTKFTRLSEEIVLLKNQCLSSVLPVSQGACNCLLGCAQHDILTVPDVITILTSLTTHNKNLPQILHTVVTLQNTADPKLESRADPISTHTLVYVLKQCGDAWKPILDLISVSSSSNSWRLKSLDYYLPVFSHILCTRGTHLTHAAKQSAWQLLARLTTEKPRVRILLDHFVWYQSSTPNNPTEEISFLSHIYKDIIATYPSYSALFLLYYVDLLVTALETNSNILLLWQHIEFLTTKVLAYRLNIDINVPVHPHRHMVKITMEEIVPMTLLLLAQCIPHCDEENLKQLLSTCQILIRYFSIKPALYCSFLMPLLPWLSVLSAAPRSNPTNKSSVASSDVTRGPTSKSSAAAARCDPKGDQGVDSDPSLIVRSDMIKTDIEEFIQMLVTSLKPPHENVPGKKVDAVKFFVEADVCDSEMDYWEEVSDLDFYYEDEDFVSEEEESSGDVEMKDSVTWRTSSVYNNPAKPGSSFNNKFGPISSLGTAQTKETTNVHPSGTNPTTSRIDPTTITRNPTSNTMNPTVNSNPNETNVIFNPNASGGNKTSSSPTQPHTDRAATQSGAAKNLTPRGARGKQCSSMKFDDSGSPSKKNEDIRSPQTKKAQFQPGSHLAEHRRIRKDETQTYLNSLASTPVGTGSDELQTRCWDGNQSEKDSADVKVVNILSARHRKGGRCTQPETGAGKVDTVPGRLIERNAEINRRKAEISAGLFGWDDNHVEWNQESETIGGNDNRKGVVNEESPEWVGFYEKDRKVEIVDELALWGEEKQRLFAASNRVTVAQGLIGKLNKAPICLWDTHYGNYPAYTCLLAGSLAATFIQLPVDNDFHCVKDKHSEAWDFLIAQDPGNALYLLLYLLAREKNAYAIHHWLERLVTTAHDNDNVPTILAILESLKRTRDPVLTSLLISLYATLFCLAPRGTFQFLLPLLSENTSHMKPWEYDVVRANATLHILRHAKPEIYGKELVPLLSSILSTYSDPQSSTAPVTLSLDAIRELCSAGVVDFASVWASLGVLRHDSRPRVLVSLIGLMECAFPSSDSNVGTDLTPSSELSYEISNVLWTYVEQNISVHVTAAAFRALSRYNFTADYPLKYLHPTFRAGIKIPKSILGKVHQSSKTPEDHVMFIPGECFLNLLERVDYASALFSPDCCLYRYNQQGRPIFTPLGWDETTLVHPWIPHKCFRHGRLQLCEDNDELDAEIDNCAECNRPTAPAYRSYNSFIQLMTSCVEHELNSYREIIYNSPYQDQVHSKEPANYSYLPYKSLLRALVKFIQVKIQAGPSQMYQPQALLVLDLLKSSYSKPLPPLNWSFLVHAYLKQDSDPSKTNPSLSQLNSAHSETYPIAQTNAAEWCVLHVLHIVAQNCGSSAETSRSLIDYLRSSEIPVSQATALSYHLPVLCEHLDSTVFQQYVETNLKKEYDYYVERVNPHPHEESKSKRGADSEKSKEKDEVMKEPRTLADQCTRPDCSNPFAILNFLQGIKDSFTKLGPQLTGLHLPPTTNLESNMLFLCTLVKQMFVDVKLYLIEDHYELFSHVLGCIAVMPLPHNTHLFSNLSREMYNEQFFLLNLYRIKERQLSLSMKYLCEHLLDKSYPHLPTILKAYTQQEVVHFILHDVFPYVIKEQGENFYDLRNFLLVVVFSMSPLSFLLPFSLEEISTLLAQHYDSFDFDHESIYAPMEAAFPVAFASLLHPEQYGQAISYLTTILQLNFFKCEDNCDFSLMFHRTLLTLKSHISESARLGVLSFCLTK